LLAGFVIGEEAPKADAQKPDAPKKEATPKSRNYRGTLAAKPADAAADVLAVLTVKSKGKETTYNVVATDQAAIDKIKDLLAKGGEVAVKGMVSEDGKSITASDAAVAPVKPAGGQGGKGKSEKKAQEAAPALQ
jgi:hypothetical protein